MKRTHQNFLKLANLYKNQTAQTEEAALDYQNATDPMDQRVCYAFVFCKLYPLMMHVTSKFSYVDESDKSHCCCMELTKAMRDFDPNKKTQLATLFSRYITNRLHNEIDELTSDKRKCNNLAENYEDAIVDTDLEYAPNAYDDSDFMLSLRSMNLSSNELKYCELIVKSSSKIKDSDIATILGISSAAIHYIKKSLGQKLSFGI